MADPVDEVAAAKAAACGRCACARPAAMLPACTRPEEALCAELNEEPNGECRVAPWPELSCCPAKR
eukprot:scaffold127841_cov28-Tisochrysis_lutea.AAC.6